MNNLWCTNYSSVRTNTRFTVVSVAEQAGLVPTGPENPEDSFSRIEANI